MGTNPCLLHHLCDEEFAKAPGCSVLRRKRAACVHPCSAIRNVPTNRNSLLWEIPALNPYIGFLRGWGLQPRQLGNASEYYRLALILVNIRLHCRSLVATSVTREIWCHSFLHLVVQALAAFFATVESRFCLKVSASMPSHLSRIVGSPNNNQVRRTSLSITAVFALFVASPNVIGAPPLKISRYIS